MPSERLPTDDRKKQIADAVLKIIAEQGLGRFRVSTIAKEVGLSEGALYRHFPDIKAMVNAAIDRTEDLLFEDFPLCDHPPLTRLREFFLRRIGTASKNRGIVSLLFSDELAQAADDSGEKKIKGMKKRSAGFIVECLEEARTEKYIRDDLKIENLVLLIQGCIMALLLFDKTHGKRPLGQERMIEFWNMIEQLILVSPKQISTANF